ncbi:MAG: type 1 periplasmic binding fold superfamily protein [Sphingobacteriales bacterium]|nr:type 1 periplasmic binding fold superfamily protein [Sphingobacteriales bacterium]MCC7223204.1 hypothetical protein [Chitinophagales bacterium]
MKHSIGLLCLCLLALLGACKKDEPCENDDCNEETELITTLKVKLVNPLSSNSNNAIYFTFSDSDGDGGNAPIITTDPLQANQTYQAYIEVLDESKTPADTITAEIQEEGDQHQFFYTVETGLNLGVTYNDADANGAPIGLNTLVAAGAASSGTLTITLKHQPNGTKNNSINTGETDIQVAFPVAIQ